MSIFKKDKVILDMQTIATLVSEGCVIDGNVKAPAFARIDGHITGDVIIDEGLILGEKGVIKGNVITKEMIVYGTVNGNLQVTSLQIKTSGRVTGDIYTQVLEVETGAIYDGILSMTQSGKLIPPQNSKPAEIPDNKPAEPQLFMPAEIQDNKPSETQNSNSIQSHPGKSKTRRPGEIAFRVER